MKRTWITRAVKFLVWAAVALTVLGLVVMLLWNKLVPPIFGWKPVGFWQALGLLLLSWILFGGLRGRPGHSAQWRERLIERWERLTPEERAKLCEGLHSRWGGAEPPATKPGA